MNRPLSPRGKRTQYLLGMRLGEPQSDKKKSLHCPYQESNPGRPAHSIVAILTELSRLLCTVCGTETGDCYNRRVMGTIHSRLEECLRKCRGNLENFVFKK